MVNHRDIIKRIDEEGYDLYKVTELLLEAEEEKNKLQREIDSHECNPHE